MRIVIAPNAFKGSLSAQDAAQCIADGLKQSSLNCESILFPIADGGDNTVPLLIKGMLGKTVSAKVNDPLGRMTTAGYGWVAHEKKALIGISEASGIRLLHKGELNPLHANTFGTGELIKAALDRGAEALIIGVGGSATTDGATGLLRALGLHLMKENGEEITGLPMDLIQLATIDRSGLDPRLKNRKITVLCDVRNTLLGTHGAAAVYGPQKGADEQMVLLLEACLQKWNDITLRTLNIDMASLEFGGAAGGVAAGLAAFTQAKLVNGIDFFLDEMHFEEALEKTDLVITAEGSIDEQTLEGKGPYGVARRAKASGIPVIGMAGWVPETPTKGMGVYFDSLISINPPQSSLAEAMRNTAVNLTRTAYELGIKLLSGPSVI